jgi:ParB-like chromosome segregation protein Spo0J
MEINITKMQVSKLKPAPYNPRKISPQEMNKLKRSIEEYGVVENLVFNKRTGFVVGGNQRLKAIKALKIKEVPVIVVDLDEQREKALNLALNKISGEWDNDALKLVLQDLDASTLDLTGFDSIEIEDLLEDIGEPFKIERVTPPHETADDPIAPPPPTTKGAGKFVVYLAFKTKEAADNWLKENLDDDDGIKAGKKTKVVVMT